MITMKPSTFQQHKEKLRASISNLKNNGIKGVIKNQQISPSSSLDYDPSGYSLGDHMEYLHMHPHMANGASATDASSMCCYYSDVSHLLCDSLIPGLVKDYCVPLSDEEWEARSFGLDPLSSGSTITTSTTTSTSGSSSSSSTASPSFCHLPIRTMTIRLAPDIMTSAIVDAIHDACRDTFVTHQVLKRFQGHFQCMLVPEDQNEVPFIFDTRVCTSRTGVLERHLLLRIYYADSLKTSNSSNTYDDSSSSSNHSDHSYTKPKKQPSPAQRRAQVLQSLQESTTMMVPMNLHLRSACAFLQYMGQQHQLQQKSSNNNNNVYHPSAILSPHPSPKTSTSFFLGNFQPTLSVQQWNAKTPLQYRFPCLNSQDWSLLQSTWTMVSSLWRNLAIHNCLFHTYRLVVPSTLPTASAGESSPAAATAAAPGAISHVAPVVLDMHYCSQIRQIARDTMLKDLESSLDSLQTSLENMEATYQGFTLVLQKALLGYQMAKHDKSHSKTPTLAKPTKIPPIGYLQLAEMVAKCVTVDSNKTAAQICDETIIKTFKTFGSQDDKESRKYIKDANTTIMKRMVQLQEIQRDAIRALESHANTQTVSRAFSHQARMATNTLGRVDRFLMARVPLLDMELVGNGRCQITASNLLCWWERILTLGGNSGSGVGGGGGSNHSGSDSASYSDKRTVILVDLRAVQFQVLNNNCISVLEKKTKAPICKLFTTKDMPNFVALMQCLQQHQDDLVNLLGSLHYPNQYPNALPPPPSNGGSAATKGIDHRGIDSVTEL